MRRLGLASDRRPFALTLTLIRSMFVLTQQTRESERHHAQGGVFVPFRRPGSNVIVTVLPRPVLGVIGLDRRSPRFGQRHCRRAARNPRGRRVPFSDGRGRPAAAHPGGYSASSRSAVPAGSVAGGRGALEAPSQTGLIATPRRRRAITADATWPLRPEPASLRQRSGSRLSFSFGAGLRPRCGFGERSRQIRPPPH
jgi:hypothetical protein